MPRKLLTKGTTPARKLPEKTCIGSAAFFNRLRAFKSADWTKVQKRATVHLFERMAKGVPAYRTFLKAHGVSTSKGVADLHLSDLPSISKANYLNTSAFKDIFWNGSVKTNQVLTSTSGSTGKPVYFARTSDVDEQSSLVHELFFRTSSLSTDKPTLVVACFGMGVWIGGILTYQAFELLGRRGYPIAVIAPGINKKEIFKILRDLAPSYEQLILCGYPPFLKDIIDEAPAQGISFDKHKVALLFAAEAFTEQFREYVAKKANIHNPLTDIANVYGSADIGTMAIETPLSILVRRLAMRNPQLFAELFRGIKGTAKTPTLAQFIPDFVSFDAPNGEILITGDSAIPLMRYSIGDHGGVHTYEEVKDRLKAYGIDLVKEAKKVGIDRKIFQLPFVYVYERIDLASTLYGLQVYPEMIKEVLLKKEFNQLVTGKLTLVTKFDDNQDQYLEINIERRPGKEISPVLEAELLSEIFKNLREKSSEFRELSTFLGKRAEPRLVFWNYEDPLYFKPGIKQQWVIRPQ